MKILFVVPFLIFIERTFSSDVEIIEYEFKELPKDLDLSHAAIVKSELEEHFFDILKVLDSMIEDDLFPEFSVAQNQQIHVLEDFNVERFNQIVDEIFKMKSEVMSQLQLTRDEAKQQMITFIAHRLAQDTPTKRKKQESEDLFDIGRDIVEGILPNKNDGFLNKFIKNPLNEVLEIFEDSDQEDTTTKRKKRESEDSYSGLGGFLDKLKSTFKQKEDKDDDDVDFFDIRRDIVDGIQSNKDDDSRDKIKNNPFNGVFENLEDDDQEDDSSPLDKLIKNPLEGVLGNKFKFDDEDNPQKGVLESTEDDQEDDSSKLIKNPLEALQGNKDDDEKDDEESNFSDSWREWMGDFLSAKKEKFRKLHDNSKQSMDGVLDTYKDYGESLLDIIDKIQDGFRSFFES